MRFVGLEAPVTIVICTIIHSYWTYWHQLSYRGGLALYVLLFKSCKILHSSHGLTCCEETMDHCMRSTWVGQQTCFFTDPSIEL